MASLESQAGPTPDGPRWFATTHWSVVLAARAEGSSRGSEALAQLCHAYWYPLYAHARRRGNDHHAAQDLTQEFFARLLEKQWLNSAAPERGRFRSFLLAIRYFGDYELLEEIARGGMGVVWKARQVSLSRIVAVKVLLAGKFSSPEFIQRFRKEAEAAANLQHPNIVAIHEVGEHERQQYFSMDYVDGPNLAQAIHDSRFTIYDFPRAARYVKQVAEAIHYAHQRGVIHRDLKPSNVLLDANDQPRVTDFGLAKRLTSTSDFGPQTSDFDLTLTGQVLGTPGFMPPEQASGRRGAVTAASDIYYLLAGRSALFSPHRTCALRGRLTGRNSAASPRVGARLPAPTQSRRAARP